jgi:hypothetical protein
MDCNFYSSHSHLLKINIRFLIPVKRYITKRQNQHDLRKKILLQKFMGGTPGKRLQFFAWGPPHEFLKQNFFSQIMLILTLGDVTFDGN